MVMYIPEFNDLGKWMSGKVHMLAVYLALGDIRLILRSHKKQLTKYKAERAYWNQRIIRKREIIKEYEGYLKTLRKETCPKPKN